MKRKLDLNIVETWALSVGGYDEAAQLIKRKLECSLSKGIKIARGAYDSTPSPSEQKDLAELLNVSRDALFPLVEQGKSRTRSAS